MRIAVVGATGLVGGEMLEVLGEFNLPITELYLVASERSGGKKMTFKGKEITVIGLQTAVDIKPDVAIFSAGGDTSLAWAPKFAEAGTVVVDNSSAWRMDPTKKLVVPEINAKELTKDDKIIANPNCSTIQMVLALAPLHDKYGIKRVVVSTYQSVTGSGKAAIDQLQAERRGDDSVEKCYPHEIDLNVIPHIDVFQENGYTKEEMKMYHETKKIMNSDIDVSATCVRVPVMRAHSEAIWCETESPVTPAQFREVCEATEGITVVDDLPNLGYPMPYDLAGKDDVYVGRIREDLSNPNGITFWSVSDQIRKGAALNAVQIAEYIVENELVGA